MSSTYNALVAKHADLEPRDGYYSSGQLLPLSVADIITILRHPGVIDLCSVDLSPSRVADCLDKPLERSLVCLNVVVREAAERAAAHYLLADVIAECERRRERTVEKAAREVA